MGKLNGKTAIVTGASRGIGKAIAEVLASEGAAVACAARTLKEGSHKTLEGSLETTVAAIEAAGGRALAIPTDIAEEEACARLIASAKQALGPVDILVNCAAVNYLVPVKDYPIRRWMSYFAVNLHAPFMLSKMVLPDMIERRGGRIVNVSSVGAIGPGRGPYLTAPTGAAAGGTMYGASKAALERFTQGLAQEVYQYGVGVSCVAPSLGVPTPGTIYFKLHTGYDDPHGEPAIMMARAVLLLASEPLDRVAGRVTYSQAILKEFGWIKQGRGLGIDRPGSGPSRQ